MQRCILCKTLEEMGMSWLERKNNLCTVGAKGAGPGKVGQCHQGSRWPTGLTNGTGFRNRSSLGFGSECGMKCGVKCGWCEVCVKLLELKELQRCVHQNPQQLPYAAATHQEKGWGAQERGWAEQSARGSALICVVCCGGRG